MTSFWRVYNEHHSYWLQTGNPPTSVLPPQQLLDCCYTRPDAPPPTTPRWLPPAAITSRKTSLLALLPSSMRRWKLAKLLAGVNHLNRLRLVPLPAAGAPSTLPAA
ncbi:hypothetical protein VitviT2T_024328 [Vitis vinifera]|uniref:Uncharacterized protein n=1 Tax=Vitis vinifera TaxID=29760 RepID=A0ABY9DFE0_VITVI|nr:hypothetical protein VitviT2T_024328 [Vitis vinifera]